VANAKPAAKPVVAAAKPVAPKAVAAPAAKKAVVKVAPKVAPMPVAAAPVVKAAAPAAPVVKAKAPAKKKAVARTIDPGQRANYIEVAAFYIAERRGFTPGNPEQDYLDAAAEIDGLIAAGHFSK
jgi:hypothetical protein